MEVRRVRHPLATDLQAMGDLGKEKLQQPQGRILQSLTADLLISIFLLFDISIATVQEVAVEVAVLIAASTATATVAEAVLVVEVGE